jgi:hypothetical protein
MNDGQKAFFFHLILALFVLVFVVVALSFPREVRLLPLLIGSGTLIFLVALMIGEFYPGAIRWMETTLDDLWGGGSGDAAPGTLETIPWGGVIRIVAWILGFLAGVFLLGFFVVPPLFVALFLIVEARVMPLRATLASVIANGILFAGMAGLKVELWTGAIPEILEGYIGGGIIPPL